MTLEINLLCIIYDLELKTDSSLKSLLRKPQFPGFSVYALCKTLTQSKQNYEETSHTNVVIFSIPQQN